jgi:hypothetical protein
VAKPFQLRAERLPVLGVERTLAWLAVGYDRRQQKYPLDNLWAYGAQPAQLERVRRTRLQRAGAGVS